MGGPTPRSRTDPSRTSFLPQKGVIGDRPSVPSKRHGEPSSSLTPEGWGRLPRQGLEKTPTRDHSVASQVPVDGFTVTPDTHPPLEGQWSPYVRRRSVPREHRTLTPTGIGDEAVSGTGRLQSPIARSCRPRPGPWPKRTEGPVANPLGLLDLFFPL